MVSPYEAALRAATNCHVKTQWTDYAERLDVLPANDRQTRILRSWLASFDSAVAQDPSTWRAIKSNWISFLSATSENPSPILAPNPKIFQRGQGPESKKAVDKRFSLDRRHRLSAEKATWAVLGLENKVGNPRCFGSVWTAMICFLIYCHRKYGALKNMGLTLTNNCLDDMFDVKYYSVSGQENQVWEETGVLVKRIAENANSDPQRNPLLWWTIVLVRSCLEPGPDDFISRGRFDGNILPMDLNIEQRLLGIVRLTRELLHDPPLLEEYQGRLDGQPQRKIASLLRQLYNAGSL